MGLTEPKSVGGSGSTVLRNPTHLGGPSSKRRMAVHAASSLSIRRRSTSASTVSLLSENEPRESMEPVSCVNRETSKVDCTRQKFIVWAAVKRNRSVRMAASERLRCPLLRCGEQFCDHETMLRHLTDCRHFATGEYVCYECMRVERLKDAKCNCCLGRPTKRRRVINLAKNFFSHLGHKSPKEPPATRSALIFEPEEFTVMPPPRYDSLPGLDIEQSTSESGQIQPELSGNEILEMEAEPVGPAQLDSINYETRDQFGHSNIGESHAVRMPQAPLSPEATSSPTSLRPALALDTRNLDRPRKVPRTTYLSPSSSLRSTSTSQEVSPISAGSGIWSSIGTNLASPITPFSPTDLESGTLSRDNSCKFPKDYAPDFSTLPGWIMPDTGSSMAADLVVSDTDKNYTCDSIPELPGDDPRSVPRALGSDPMLFCFDPKDDYSWSSTVDTEVNVLFTSGNPSAPPVGENLLQEREADEDTTSNSETRTLVHTSWDALLAHISTSLDKIETQVSRNRIADSFKHMSPKQIAINGLACLRNILNGGRTKDPIEYLCFVHLVYSFFVLVHEDDLSNRCKTLFHQALAYRTFLSSADSNLYTQLVKTIWQPAGDEAESSAAPNAVPDRKGKEPDAQLNPMAPFSVDPLVLVAQNFLDDLEMSAIANLASQPDEIVTSELFSTHVSETEPSPLPQSATDAFAVTANCIVQMLTQSYGGADFDLFSRKLRRVGRRVTDGRITSVRRLELELLRAGKETFPRGCSQLFDGFIPQVRRLCDPLYVNRGAHSRTTYHMLGIALVESLIQTIDDQHQPSLEQAGMHAASSFDFDLAIPNGVDPFAEFLETFDNSLVEGTNIQQTQHDAFTIATPALNTPELHISGEQSTTRTGGLKRPAETTIETLQETSTAASAHRSTTIDPISLNATNIGAPASIANDSVQNSTTTNSPRLGPHLTDTNAHQSDPAPTSSTNPQQRVEANSCCEICGYRPKGDPQWFKGSMAKHKKLQHSTDPPKIYKCPFPGCPSAYKNRPDNLRQHQLEKGHFVDGGDERGRRPGKRKKMS